MPSAQQPTPAADDRMSDVTSRYGALARAAATG
jgi:hypothetical protein